jgi:hypothetical protein
MNVHFNASLSNVRRIAFGAVSAAALVLVTGCAHPISMAPDMKAVPESTAKVHKKIGYFISAEDLAKEVTTPGGGGDKVKYLPYKDMETGIYKAFSQVFDGVVKLKSADDKASMGEQGLSLVIKPTLSTTSFSDSAFTWPPTQFTVDITCVVTDAKGAEVTRLTSQGKGAATFSEFTSDFSLSAKRASQDALAKLVRDLSASDALRR